LVVSPLSAFVITGVAGLLPSLSIYLFLTLQPREQQRLDMKTALQQHWNHGRWLALASLLQWSTVHVYTLLVAGFLNLQSTGGMRAIQTFAQPLEQGSTALGLLLMPWAARLSSPQEPQRLTSFTHKVSWILVTAGLIYLAAVWIFRQPLVEFVYKGKFAEYTWLMPCLIGVPIMMALSRGAQIGVRAIRQPKLLLSAYGASAAVSLVAGLTLVPATGLRGAAIGMLLAAATFSLVLRFLFLQHNGNV
jgi:O-antigen/teichoic acid export membrane protein